MPSRPSAAAAAAMAGLTAADPVMAGLIEAHGPPEFSRRRVAGGHFAALARAIAYQQLAGAAASMIHGRFEALFEGPPSAEAVLAAGETALRGVGFSAAKTASVLDLADRV